MHLLSKRDSLTGRFKMYRTNRFRAQGPRLLQSPPLRSCNTIKGQCVICIFPYIWCLNDFFIIVGTEAPPTSDK